MRFFGLDYVERTTLRDGSPIVLRLLAPEDRALLLAGFERLSPDSRYARFLGPKTTLNSDELRYLTEIDQETHFAIGAIREEGDGHGDAIGLGLARFIVLEPGLAEAAIAVADEAQGQGLGKLLFLRLCAAAAERGIERFRCEVLGSNVAMAALIEKIDPARRVEAGGGVMSIELVLPHVTPTESATAPAPESPMYRLFRAFAARAVQWTDRFWAASGRNRK